jgi:hypothetical protein
MKKLGSRGFVLMFLAGLTILLYASIGLYALYQVFLMDWRLDVRSCGFVLALLAGIMVAWLARRATTNKHDPLWERRKSAFINMAVGIFSLSFTIRLSSELHRDPYSFAYFLALGFGGITWGARDLIKMRRSEK